MTEYEYTTLRQQIERLLVEANEKYPLGERFDLRRAILGFRREGKDPFQRYRNISSELASGYYGPLVSRLEIADEHCSETEVRELERLIDEGFWGSDDDIRRETDPDYVEHELRTALFSFCEQQDFDGARILDFGSGAGASTIVLSRLLPRSSFVGVDLDERLVALARERSMHHGIKAEFYVSPSPRDLPNGLGVFDFVVLNAVWEHLLPDERPILLSKLLDVLRKGGVLFICETPHRWFPIELHTTGLPLLNYVPAWVVLRFARGRRGLPANI